MVQISFAAMGPPLEMYSSLLCIATVIDFRSAILPQEDTQITDSEHRTSQQTTLGLLLRSIDLEADFLD